MSDQLDRIEAALEVLLVRTDPGPLPCDGLTRPHVHSPSPYDWAMPVGEQKPTRFCLGIDGKRLDGGSSGSGQG